ncbi:MAG: PTS sugar transporter subunit IIC/EAL domain-containing protein [Velocimicrobium sp.]
MYEKIFGITYQLENNKILCAIKDSFLSMIPIVLIGAVAMVIKSFPIPVVQSYLSTVLDGFIVRLLDGIYNATYGLLSIFLTIAISYNYSSYFYNKNQYLRISVIAVSIGCLAASLGIGQEGFQIQDFSTTGLFTAIVIPILSIRIFFFLYQKIYQIKFRRKPRKDEVEYRHISTLVIPFMITMLVFFFVNHLLYKLLGVISLNDLFAIMFEHLFAKLGNHLGAGFLLIFMEHILWFFGIHGGNALEKVVQTSFPPIYMDSTHILSKTFFDTFVLMGGCGTTICLLIAILLVSKNKKNRNIARISMCIVPFNINEILIFGIPIVFNPVMFIPFLLTPFLSFVLAYAATALGFLPVIHTTIPWTTPILLSGYLATGSIRGSLLQLVSVLIGIVIYAPFVKLMERLNKERESIYIEQMENQIKQVENKREDLCFVSQQNISGMVASKLIEKLRDAIASHTIDMYYQPQITRDDEVFGAEALLRFEYNGKKIFPPLIIELAKEDDQLKALSLVILETVCKDTKEMQERIGGGVLISVNITAEQLGDIDFVNQVIAFVNEYDVYERICLEVTEEKSMDTYMHSKENIEKLYKNHIGVAMDDFSMGYTSLKYLQDSHFSHVKLDGSLVNQMLNNERSKEIISSIIVLGNTLGFQVVAEYVDSEEKRDELVSLGCSCLQGYLYSKAVPKEKFVEFYKNK